MVIFIDLVLLENLIVNYFLLFITAQTLSLKINYKRFFITSVCAALYTLVIFIDKLKFMTTIPVTLLTAFLIVYGAFGKNKFFFVLKATLLYLAYTFVVAGIIVYLENKNTYRLEIENFSARKLLLVLMVIYIIGYRLLTYIISLQKVKKYTYNIEIFVQGQIIKIKALLDTGNELKEPITNLPVIIVEKDALTNIDISVHNKLYIPFKAVSGQANFLYGFKPDKIKINYDEDKFQFKNGIIGICDTKLSDHDEYQGLLSRDII
ncbi:MAG: sigma-E processing peptidase SpoIIGA [Clostridiales bacterium]|nr:sigma-E processing peptidase SpoIIGA [Clostridiales bacterium]